MEIKRRHFLSVLSFVIGGGVGTALSPLPWKLTDDFSIWSQNWPWTPVPPQGPVSYETSSCTLCPAGCGIAVRKVEERAVKIEGQADHPINKGGICILGLAGTQLLYSPSRIKTPLKRKGSRGGNQWEKISWDQAITEVAEKLFEMRRKHQAHSLACFAGPGKGTGPRLFQRFLTAYGSPNFIQQATVADVYEMVFSKMMGKKRPVGFDIEATDFLLSFGAGILEGWDSPVRQFRANSGRKEKKGQFFQIEHRLSNTAAKADQWLAITPGTESILALGLAHVMVKEALYDESFVNKHTHGFDALLNLLITQYPPDKVSEATGVDPSSILSLARKFAAAKKPLAVCGRGQGATPGALAEVVAVQTLNTLTGRIQAAGGIWSVPEPKISDWPDIKMDRTAKEGSTKNRIDGAASKPFSDSPYLAHKFAENILSEAAYPIEVLFVAGANPAYTLPNTARVKKALDRIPFIVSFSSFMDETAQMADLLLPDHTYLEGYKDIIAPSGFHQPFIGLAKPVVEPQFNTQAAGDTLIAIAKAVGGTLSQSFPWESYAACLEGTYKEQWEALLEDGFVMGSDPSGSALKSAIAAASGKIEFLSQELTDKPIELAGDTGSFPLLLVPYDSPRLASGNIGNTPFLTKTVANTILKGKDSFVEVSPKTAQSLGLSEGRFAELQTPGGKAKVRVHLSERIGPGLVAMPRGLGHEAYDPFLSGKGVNYNDLAVSVDDPASGMDAAWGVRAKLRKV